MKMKYYSLLLLFFCHFSCKENDISENQDWEKGIKVSPNVDESLKSFVKGQLGFCCKNSYMADYYHICEHKNELLRSLEIVEKIEVPTKKLILVFYKYSIGADVVRKTLWFKKLEGKWFLFDRNISSNEEDPFQDGNPDEAKKVLERAGKWNKESEDVWWNQGF